MNINYGCQTGMNERCCAWELECGCTIARVVLDDEGNEVDLIVDCLYDCDKCEDKECFDCPVKA